MAEIIKADGTKTEFVPKNRKYFQLSELQNVVGGYIEIVPATDGRIMIVNEEGKLKGLPYNHIASNLHGVWNDPIVGDVLVCARSEIR